MTQMPPPLDSPAMGATVLNPRRKGLGKIACLVTFVAGIALIATVLGELGKVMFSASVALWAIALLLTFAGLLPGRKKGWAFLSLLLNAAIAAWFVMSFQG
jgi:uncharacterized membrane protein